MSYPHTFLLAYQAEPLIIGLNYEKALRQLGYRVFTCDVSSHYRVPDILCEPDSDISDIIAALNVSPDVVMHFESRGFFPRGWERISIPRIWYSTEGDVHLKDHIHVMDFFDLLCSSNQVVAEYFHQHGYLSYFLPLAVDPEVHQPDPQTEVYDIAFVGTLNMLQYRERARLLNILQNEFTVHIRTKATPAECAQLYAQSKLVFDKSLGHGINTRPFEALACRKLLLTAADPVSGLETLLKDKEHLVYYHDEHDLLEQVRYYLQHDTEREQIAANGFAEVLHHHTYIQRVQQLVAWIQEHTSFGINLTPRQRHLYRDSQATNMNYAYLYVHNQLWAAAQQALATTTESVEKWSMQGVLAFQQGQLTEALQSFEKCVQTDPQNPEWAFHCASLAYENNQFGLCREWLNRVEQLWNPPPYCLYQLPNHASSLLGLYGLRGAAWFHERHYLEAQLELTQTLACPDSYNQHMHWHILNLLGLCYYHQGNAPEALRYLLESRSNNPVIAETHLLLAELYCQNQQLAEAIHILQEGRLLVKDPSHMDELLQHLLEFGLAVERPMQFG